MSMHPDVEVGEIANLRVFTHDGSGVPVAHTDALIEIIDPTLTVVLASTAMTADVTGRSFYNYIPPVTIPDQTVLTAKMQADVDTGTGPVTHYAEVQFKVVEATSEPTTTPPTVTIDADIIVLGEAGWPAIFECLPYQMTIELIDRSPVVDGGGDPVVDLYRNEIEEDATTSRFVLGFFQINTDTERRMQDGVVNQVDAFLFVHKNETIDKDTMVRFPPAGVTTGTPPTLYEVAGHIERTRSQQEIPLRKITGTHDEV